MYIDPSSGGMLFQVLAIAFGLISGVVLFFSGRIRMAIARLMRYLRERPGKSSEVVSANDEIQTPVE
jgi:hypothetical protein